MSTDELDSIFEDYEYIKLKADGFMRDFSKEAHSWGPEDEDTGVMALRRMEGEWCNGILVKGVTEEDLERYSQRETGYTIEEIDTSKLTPYDPTEEVPENVLTAIVDWELDEPNTHEEYCKLCVQAAASHGQEFLEDFLRTTYQFYGEDDS